MPNEKIHRRRRCDGTTPPICTEVNNAVFAFLLGGRHEVFNPIRMASCDPIHFTGISATVFNQVRHELAGNGFDLSGPSGVVHGPYGIVFRYNWDEASEKLDIEILDKSFFVTCHQIRTQLDKAFSRYGNTPQNLA